MRRKKGRKRGTTASVLLAMAVGYLVGGWHLMGRHEPQLSAAETVALRFPDDWSDTAQAASVDTADAARATASATSAAPSAAQGQTEGGDARLVLFNPQPMVPPPAVPEPAAESADSQPAAAADATTPPAGPPLQLASAPAADEAPAVPSPVSAAAAAAKDATKVAAVRAPRVVNRSGSVLNDAQIASIKERLHLTADQEQMWPAVEAALRNMEYVGAGKAAGRNATRASAQASVDPSTVRGLKDAAVPLILSFNTEQKEEMRNLAHVMGLDPLASHL